MIKDLLVPIVGNAGDEAALAAAIVLASSHDAHLIVALPAPMFTAAQVPWSMTSPALIAEWSAEVERNTQERAEALRNRLQRENISWEVRIETSRILMPASAMARQARHADLSVIAAPGQGDEATIGLAHFNALLFESGRPVLVVPRRDATIPSLRKIMIGWKPTREATRALHDAMTLFAPVKVDVVVALETPDSNDLPEPDPGVDIASHVARHVAQVKVHTRQVGSTSVATTMLLLAAELDADLIVSGGYGHSRLREWVLGGTTRDLLHRLELPVLFAH
jgi:nucleotide-binding universal stress UspA family protein